MHFQIREPFWSRRAVGVAIKDLDPGRNTVECIYKKKDGTREFTGTFAFDRDFVKHLQRDVQQGVELALIPLDKLQGDKK